MESLNPSHAVSSLNASFSIWLSDVRQVAQPLWCHFFIYKMRYYLQLLQICVWTRQRAWASLVAQTVKNLPVIWDLGLIPGLGRSPGGAQGNLLQHSCLENPMDRGAWWAVFQRVAKSWTRLKWLSTHILVCTEEGPLETCYCIHCGSLLQVEFFPTHYIGARRKYSLVLVSMQAVLHLGTCFTF